MAHLPTYYLPNGLLQRYCAQNSSGQGDSGNKWLDINFRPWSVPRHPCSSLRGLGMSKNLPIPLKSGMGLTSMAWFTQTSCIHWYERALFFSRSLCGNILWTLTWKIDHFRERPTLSFHLPSLRKQMFVILAAMFSQLISHTPGKERSGKFAQGEASASLEPGEVALQREELGWMSRSQCLLQHCSGWLWVRMDVTTISWAVSSAGILFCTYHLAMSLLVHCSELRQSYGSCSGFNLSFGWLSPHLGLGILWHYHVPCIFFF